MECFPVHFSSKVVVLPVKFANLLGISRMTLFIVLLVICLFTRIEGQRTPDRIHGGSGSNLHAPSEHSVVEAWLLLAHPTRDLPTSRMLLPDLGPSHHPNVQI